MRSASPPSQCRGFNAGHLGHGFADQQIALTPVAVLPRKAPAAGAGNAPVCGSRQHFARSPERLEALGASFVLPRIRAGEARFVDAVLAAGDHLSMGLLHVSVRSSASTWSSTALRTGWPSPAPQTSLALNKAGPDQSIYCTRTGVRVELEGMIAR